MAVTIIKKESYIGNEKFTYLKITIPANDIKAGNTTPITALAAGGSGYAHILMGEPYYKFTANTTPFTSTQIVLTPDTGSDSLVVISGLNGGINKFGYSGRNSSGITIIDNKSLIWTVNADSAVGDGVLVIYMDVKTIKL